MTAIIWSFMMNIPRAGSKVTPSSCFCMDWREVMQARIWAVSVANCVGGTLVRFGSTGVEVAPAWRWPDIPITAVVRQTCWQR